MESSKRLVAVNVTRRALPSLLNDVKEHSGGEQWRKRVDSYWNLEKEARNEPLDPNIIAPPQKTRLPSSFF